MLDKLKHSYYLMINYFFLICNPKFIRLLDFKIISKNKKSGIHINN